MIVSRNIHILYAENYSWNIKKLYLNSVHLYVLLSTIHDCSNIFEINNNFFFICDAIGLKIGTNYNGISVLKRSVVALDFINNEN